MGDFDEHEGHDPKREEEALAGKAKKEPPADKPAPPVSKKSDDSK